ncbi:LysR family transcriptional regulator [Campylobacter curvus]|uniref:LysR family transcriptional regulator n=1 Tax=Campylobacter curvus TaxID=200 RepID=UPI0014708163|nr:LysR family transcriptional regulator [Campylobacter curvus]
MNLRYMEFIVTLAETRSFTKAAKKLKMSQPLLSKSIISLENELKISLFERTTPLTLTKAGEIYAAKAKIMLETFEELNDQIKELNGIMTGKVRIGFSQTGYNLMPSILPKFCKKFPKADIKIVQAFSALNVRDRLIKDELDLAMLVYPMDTQGLEYQVIKEDKLYLVLPVTHELVKKYKNDDDRYPKIELKELKNEKFILPNAYQRERFEFDKIFKKAGFAPNIFCESETADITVSIVASGVGACFVPPQFIKGEVKERVMLFDINEPLLKQTLILAHKQDKKLSKLALEFIKMAKDEQI